MTENNSAPKGLYIHIPFCKRKCRYCDFFSVSESSLIPDYIKAVIRNIPGNISFDTVYFGGGTPSLLAAGQIADILAAADITDNAEISMECNPCSVTEDYLKEIRKAGVNRISIGVQSLKDNELSALGRLHNADEGAAAVRSASAAGFDNISADLMLAIPMQTKESLLYTVERLCALPVTHISAYMLKVERGTPLAADEGLIKMLPHEDEAADFYLAAVSKAGEWGFSQYEISNFAKGDDHICRHNMKYWRCGEYLGIGTGAHSYLDGARFEAAKNIGDFIKDERQRTVITDSSPGSLSERIMLALRLTEGIDTGGLEKCAGNAAEKITAAALPMEKAGLLRIAEGKISLTPKGFLVSNEIILRLTEGLD